MSFDKIIYLIYVKAWKHPYNTTNSMATLIEQNSPISKINCVLKAGNAANGTRTKMAA